MALEARSDPMDHFALLESGEVHFVMSALEPSANTSQLRSSALDTLNFVLMMRADHPLARGRLTMKKYLAASHAMAAIEFVFNEALLLEAGQYFFVPRVAFDEPGPNGDIAEFYWLSSAKPIDASGTPFDGDLQSWIRDEDLQPDWLRVGTDVIGAGAFNAAFTLDGETVDADVPLPAPVALMTLGLLGFTLRKRTAR